MPKDSSDGGSKAGVPSPLPPFPIHQLYRPTAVRHFRDHLPLLLVPAEIESDQSRPPALPDAVTRPVYVNMICDIIRHVVDKKHHSPDFKTKTEIIGE